ncbi:MAG TPA: DedA family protein [Candidatus Dormibacteraeota bacterium]|nr:DedA family protein [Candidatus Dormibacteraeota bacterium]
MSSADLPVSGRRRLLASLRSSRSLQIGAAILVVVVVLIVLAFLYGDLPEFVHGFNRLSREFLRRNAFLPGFAALYLEESGIPLPAPGDVFVMYVGVHVPHQLTAWIMAWLGLILAVVLGATNLFLLARKYGRPLAESSYAEYLHLSHSRLLRAEKWFRRYGVLAIIFGRHIPGFRIPITVAAGVFEVPYRVFAPSVAVSTAIWAGVVLIIGVKFGPRLGTLLQAHTFLYFAWGAIVLALVLSIFVRQRVRAARERRARSVESRSSSTPT